MEPHNMIPYKDVSGKGLGHGFVDSAGWRKKLWLWKGRPSASVACWSKRTILRTMHRLVHRPCSRLCHTGFQATFLSPAQRWVLFPANHDLLVNALGGDPDHVGDAIYGALTGSLLTLKAGTTGKRLSEPWVNDWVNASMIPMILETHDVLAWNLSFMKALHDFNSKSHQSSLAFAGHRQTDSCSFQQKGADLDQYLDLIWLLSAKPPTRPEQFWWHSNVNRETRKKRCH